MRVQLLTDISSSRFPLNHSNRVIHSRLRNFRTTEPDSGLSLKMVLKGKETYRTENSIYEMTPGNFFLVNRHQQIECEIESDEVVEGMCFYINPELFAEVLNGMEMDDGLISEVFSDTSSPEVFEASYNLSVSPLGKFLQQSASRLQDGLLEELSEDFFISLSEHLAHHQFNRKLEMDNINVVKASTRVELYRRLLIARQMIEDKFADKILVSELAREACLSEYHLHRTFRQAFGTSPHQYQIRFRLKKAAEWLMDSGFNVSQVALKTGFSDIHAFSKAFKNRFGIPPGKYRRQHN